MKKYLLILIALIAVLAVGLGLVYFYGDKKVKAPTDINSEQPLQKGLTVLTPKANETILSPLKISGYVNGDDWIAFEAQAGTVELLNNSGERLGFALLTTPGEWMIAEPIYFETTLKFISDVETSGFLIFRNENPSGLPEKEKEFRLPVKITASEVMAIKVFFNNSRLDSEISCNKVFPVERKVVKTQAAARAAIEELLAGLTAVEQMEDYFTSINPGVKIQKLTIENGMAKIDFDEQLQAGVGGSCRVSAIRAQITETLKQFPTVNDVIISIDGRVEDILQP